MKKRATARDVARLAGVSVSAVSRSFTPGASASENIRWRVAEAAKHLGYRPNAMARSITTRRSQLVAVVLATDTNLQYPELLSEISRAMARQHYRVLLFTLEAMREIQTTFDQLWSYQADGVLAAVRLTDSQVTHLEDHGIPVVLFNRAPGRRIVGSVSCDHSGCGRLLAERIVAEGHRRVALIQGPEASTVATERTESARAVLEAAGLDIVSLRGDFSYESGHQAMQGLVKKSGRQTVSAVIAASDMMAIGAMDCARTALKLRVPADVAFAGFDGVLAGQWDSYSLTTVRQPIRAMSEAAADLLVDRMKDFAHPAERRIFPGELIIGQSSRPG